MEITTTGATLSWIRDGSAFDIEVVEMGEDATGTPTVSGLGSQNTVEALRPSTGYEFYARQDCGDGDLSAWSGPFSFTTLCGIVTTFPYTENFDSYGTGTDAYPNCWSRPVVYEGFPSIV